jgi:hypothetical protein
MHFSPSTIALFTILPGLGFAFPAFGFGENNPFSHKGNAGANGGASGGADAGADAGAKAVTGKPKATGAAASSTLASIAAAAATYQAQAAAPVPKMTPSDTQIANAVLSWMADTGKVTKFLNTATGLTGDDFTTQATIAFNAEVDELNHKMILDAALGDQASVKAANDTLVTKGAFQTVVDDLNTMVKEGPDTAQKVVDKINANRCVNVLPNIDAYFAAAGSATVKSVRPTGCLEVPGFDAVAAGNGTAPVQTAAPVASATAGNGTASADDSGASNSAAVGGADLSATSTSAKAAGATSAVKAGAAKATGAAKAGAADAAKAAPADAAKAAPADAAKTDAADAASKKEAAAGQASY